MHIRHLTIDGGCNRARQPAETIEQREARLAHCQKAEQECKRAKIEVAAATVTAANG